jgi:putative acetyltransferase
VTFARADVADPAVAAFLLDHLAAMEPTAPPESRHALDLDGLRAPGVRLWAGHEDGVLVATGALTTVEAGHEEVKSMRTDPARRGRGIARALLTVLVEDARARGVARLSLETGSMSFFEPARALYRDAGFVPCPPFGTYRPDPNSVFLTLTL